MQVRSMNSDQYLISIPFEQGEFRLPCDAHAILQLVTQRLMGTSFSSSKSIFEFLVANPALLVTAFGAMKSLDRIKIGDVRNWIDQLDGLSMLDSIELSKSSLVVGRLRKRLAGVYSSRRFWKSIKKLATEQKSVKCNGDLKSKRLPELSNGVLKAIRKAAVKLASAHSDSASVNLHQLISRLSEIQKIQNNFDGELLRQKLDSMRLLAYGASHEINNPLANVATRAQSLLQDEVDPSRRHRLSVIYEQAMRAHEMISDMMLFAHPPKVDLKSMDLADCVRSVVDELSTQLNAANIKCEIRCHETLMVGDETKLASAIKSLIVNSVEAIGSDGLIQVEIDSSDSNGVCLEISDDGPGIDPEIGANIFDPFFSGREAGRGLGFGLSKAWRIAQMHGATIERSESKLGGALFVIRFPVVTNSQQHIALQKQVAA